MNDWMEVLGWTLVHFCWQATGIALVYRLTDLVFAKSRSQVRYGLALTALMGMLAAAGATVGYEGVQAVQRDRVVAFEPAFHVDAAPAMNAGAITFPAERVHFDLSASLVGMMPWLDALWLAGVVILSLRAAGGWFLIRRLRSSGIAKVPDELNAIFSRLAQRIGVRRRVELYLSERISGPLTVGVLRSIVLLPVSAATHLSPGQLEVVLAHELAHIRRGDYLWNMIQTVVETLFFFHPAVWWVSGHLRQERELCCDDAALACCSDPVVYATALLSLEEQRGSKPRLAMALDGHQSLKSRILRILGEKPEGRPPMAPLSLVGVCATLCLFLAPLPRLFAVRVTDAPSTLVQATAAPEPKPARPAEATTPPEPAAPENVQSPAPHPKPAARPDPITVQVRVSPSPAVAASTPRSDPHGLVSPVAPAIYVPTVDLKLPVIAPQRAREIAARLDEEMAAVREEIVAMPQSDDAATGKSDYITQMRAAGYGSDLDKLVEMKIQGITPDYARSMQNLGFGKPTDQELISLKIFHVTPETVQQMKAAGLAPSKMQDLISYQIFKVTPEFVAGMKDAGFSSISPSKLVELKIHGVTPEFAKASREQFPGITVDQLIQLRIFNIDSAFMASAKRHGFDNLTVDKLVKLRISGLLDDSDQKAEKK